MLATLAKDFAIVLMFWPQVLVSQIPERMLSLFFGENDKVWKLKKKGIHNLKFQVSSANQEGL